MPNIAKQTRWSSAAEDTAEAGNPHVVAIRADAADDPLDSFSPEQGGPATPTRRTPNPLVRVKATFIVAIATLIAIAAVAAAVFVVRQRIGTSATAAVATGRVALATRPPGAAVVIDGVDRGVTPLELDLPAGAHAVVFRSGASERRIDIQADATVRVSENVDMRARLRPTDLAGRLATGELGILLLQTPSSGAHIVARRVSRMLPVPGSSIGSVRIGVATQRDDVISGDTLIARARQQPIEPLTAH